MPGTSRRERVPQSGRSNVSFVAAASAPQQQPTYKPKVPKKREDLKVSEGDEFGHLTGGSAAMVTARVSASPLEEKKLAAAAAAAAALTGSALGTGAKKARDGHVFGLGFGKTRHMQVRDGIKSYAHFALLDKPLKGSDAAHHTIWRDRGLQLKKKYRGRPRGVDGIVGLDIDG